ncbi:outer membrane beta-barrel protein [Myxococcota bacterium]|nr:outer membrane beta-barrel protein [Myxococcota bacterium]
MLNQSDESISFSVKKEGMHHVKTQRYASDAASPVGSILVAISLTAAFLASPLMAVSVAGAQEMNLPSGVTERVAPESDALGTKLGGFTAYPKLGVSTGYNSNLYAADNDEKSSGVFMIDPSLAFDSNWSRNKLSFGGFLSQALHNDRSQEDNTNWGVGGSGQLDVLEDSNIKGSLGYERLTERRGGINANLAIPDPIQYELFQWGLLGNHRINKLTLSAAVDFDSFDYSPTSGQIQDYRNRDLWVFTGQGGYEFSPGYSGFVRGVFNDRSFENRSVTTGAAPGVGLQQDSQGYEITAGISSEITNLISGEAYIGYLDQDYQAGGFDDVSGVSFGLDLVWEATQMTTVRLTASRDVADATVPGTGGIFYSVGGFGVDHELMPSVFLKGDFSYYNANYEGSSDDREDDGYRASVGADYRFSRILHLDLLYTFDERDSNVDGQDYTGHQVTFGVRLQH